MSGFVEITKHGKHVEVKEAPKTVSQPPKASKQIKPAKSAQPAQPAQPEQPAQPAEEVEEKMVQIRQSLYEQVIRHSTAGIPRRWKNSSEDCPQRCRD